MSVANDERLLADLTEVLSAVPGVRAIALGGSRARGTATPHSDYDIGLYYDGATPLDVAALGRVATEIDDRGDEASVTPIGGWGPWIDGGGWLVVEEMRVDLLYRDLAKVSRVIDECHAGKVDVVYQPGHPHAFISSIYAGEVALCKVLHDPEGALAAQRARLASYPEALRGELRRRFEWEAYFSLENAEKAKARADTTYIMGCVFRSIACLCQSLHAINDVWLLNEKGAVAGVTRLARKPAVFAERVNMILRDVSQASYASGLERLDELIAEVRAITS
ncbi:MAG: nucleotidyltransferase domain-containing protein [Alphaproteobacteria bacterium]|nr:nucleotidyltransferase domain-containing protein [Alphaproteobacteria bacterium]